MSGDAFLQLLAQVEAHYQQLRQKNEDLETEVAELRRGGEDLLRFSPRPQPAPPCRGSQRCSSSTRGEESRASFNSGGVFVSTRPTGSVGLSRPRRATMYMESTALDARGASMLARRSLGLPPPPASLAEPMCSDASDACAVPTDTRARLAALRLGTPRLTLLKMGSRRRNMMSRPRTWLMNPESSSFLWRWDILTMLALCFVALATPIQVALLAPTLDWFFFVSVFIDAIFFADMCLHFFIMFPKKADFGMVMVSSHKQVVWHYVRTWFIVDFISVVPVDLVTLVRGGTELKMLKMVRFLRLLKLARMLRASRIVTRFEMRMTISYGKLSLIRFFAGLFVLMHWLSCLWALTLVIVDEGGDVPRWIDNLDVLEENVNNPTRSTPWKLYVTCLYFTSYTITSIGYGDIAPVNIAERIVCTLMIMVAGTTWALVLGQVSDVVATMHSDELDFQRRMDALGSMMADHVLPESMRQRLRGFFLSSKVAQQRARRQLVMGAMSPGLRAEVTMEVNKTWISRVSFLQQFLTEAASSDSGRHYRAFIADVSQHMLTEVHAQADTVGKPQTLFIVSCGLVTQNDRLLRAGSLWGSDFVLSSISHQRPYQAFALTYLELTVLRRTDFMGVVKEHKGPCPEIARRVRRFCCWVSLQRAILREARRRRSHAPRRAVEDAGGSTAKARAGSEEDAPGAAVGGVNTFWC